MVQFQNNVHCSWVLLMSQRGSGLKSYFQKEELRSWLPFSAVWRSFIIWSSPNNQLLYLIDIKNFFWDHVDLKKYKGYHLLSIVVWMDFIKATWTQVLTFLGCTWDSFLQSGCWLKAMLTNEVFPLRSPSSGGCDLLGQAFRFLSWCFSWHLGWSPLWTLGLGGDRGWPLANCRHGKSITMEVSISGACSVSFPVAMSP